MSDSGSLMRRRCAAALLRTVAAAVAIGTARATDPEDRMPPGVARIFADTVAPESAAFVEWSATLPERARELFPGQRIRVETLRAASLNPLDAMRPAMAQDISALPRILAPTRRACVKIFTPAWHGAGFFISPDGHLLTSCHVIAGAEIAIILTAKGELYTVERVAAFSQVHDLALLKVQAQPSDWIDVGPAAEPRRGEAVYVVGHPDGVSWNISTGRVAAATTLSGTQLVELNADLAKGNSGGPVVNNDGVLCAVAAYSAVLPNGRRTAMGIAAGTVQDFLRAKTRREMTLEALAQFDRNAAVLDLVVDTIFVADDFISELDPLLPRPAMSTPAVTPQSRVMPEDASRPPSPADPMAKLLLLQFFVERHLAGLDASPDLKQVVDDLRTSLRCYLRAVDRLAASRRAFGEKKAAAGENRARGAEALSLALSRAQTQCRTYERDAGAPEACRRIEQLALKYARLGTSPPAR